jgi:putative transposase
MPRQGRIDAAGALHHIICRGLERRKIFCDDSDRDDFVSRLGAILTQTSTRCYAWALLPNHAHLLLQTGMVPIATVMRRLLTGYATKFNRKYRRHGHLFQNRYKSILCQEEPYLLELIRYIHLNPLRARVISTVEELKTYRYCGHNRIFSTEAESWFAADEILARFGSGAKSSRKAYEVFVSEGVGQGRRPELIGGGLFRSAGGWSAIISAKKAGMFMKSDERILGDSDFVESILVSAEEEMERKNAYRNNGVVLVKLSGIVATVLGIEEKDIETPGKQPHRVQARDLFCFWAVRELGVTTTSLAGRFGLSQPAISLAVGRGERLIAETRWRLNDYLDVKC